ncbi:hypothetical protein NEMIN01_1474 [Nematocida minor]|uniref:uncharacterized protein n=1 Tax=Nematocida minor TaxID=1912983 RepID=UPI00221F0557|nr:uncharacterized protein NEMIN01_1474 [Nematocida minor]KAI5191315.1 hypothetical protein NEMIN01_1474 [Nematocida minor]
MGGATSNRILTAGVCAFVLFSIHPQLESPETGFFNVLSILYLSYWMGSSYLKSVAVLYFILNSTDVLYIISRGRHILTQNILYSTKIPVLSNISQGRSLYKSIKSKSIAPIFVSVLLRILFEIAWSLGNQSRNIAGTIPLLSSSVVHIHSSSVYMHTSSEYYGEYKGKQGSGNRKVVGDKEKCENPGWKVLLEGLEGNPPPSVRITSGSVIYLQDTETEEYLQTFDVASPLTTSNQEVSTAPSITEKSRFLIVNEDGDMSKTVPVYLDAYFYLKHVSTGVFVRVLKRRISNESKKYEINGEKETGINRNIGSKSCLWSGREITQRPRGVRKILESIIEKVCESGRQIVENAKENGRKEKESRSKRAGIYKYVYNFNVIMYIALFGLAVLRGVLGKENVWEQVMSCLLDLLICVIFKRNIRDTMYCAGVIGIQHGLKLQALVKEIMRSREKEKRS